MNRSSRQPLGFTLIELVVVILILSVLVALLLAATSRAKATNNLMTCTSNLRQIAVGVHTYLGDHNQKMPPAPAMALNAWLIETVGGAQLTGPRIKPTWGFAEQGPTVKAWICPADPTRGGLVSLGGTHGVPDHLPNMGVNAHSYLPNALLFNRNMTEIPRPGQTILATEYPWAPQGTRAIWPSQNPWSDKMLKLDWHGGKMICVFVDGHAEAIKNEDLFWGRGKSDHLWYSDYPDSGATEKM